MSQTFSSRDVDFKNQTFCRWTLGGNPSGTFSLFVTRPMSVYQQGAQSMCMNVKWEAAEVGSPCCDWWVRKSLRKLFTLAGKRINDRKLCRWWETQGRTETAAGTDCDGSWDNSRLFSCIFNKLCCFHSMHQFSSCSPEKQNMGLCPAHSPPPPPQKNKHAVIYLRLLLTFCAKSSRWASKSPLSFTVALFFPSRIVHIQCEQHVAAKWPWLQVLIPRGLQ